MKTLEFLYQETEIHFLVNPTDENVMVNATEMAKLFDRKTKYYLETDATKKLIQCFSEGIYDGEKEIIRAVKTDQIIQDRGRNGIYFHRELAIDFAGWLDTQFKRWLLFVIDQILFENLKIYRDAMKEELEAKNQRETLKEQAKENPCKETIDAYFENEDKISSAKNKKNTAARNQRTLFQQDFVKQ